MNKVKPIIVAVSWLLVIITLLTIAFFSLQDGKKSTKTSDKVTEVIVPNKDTVSHEGMRTLTTLIRKSAHFSIYTVLGLVLSIAFYFTLEIWVPYLQIISFSASLLYSIVDEYIYQAITPQRMPSAIDVIIDMNGAILGILILSVIIIVKRHMQKK